MKVLAHRYELYPTQIITTGQAALTNMTSIFGSGKLGFQPL